MATKKPKKNPLANFGTARKNAPKALKPRAPKSLTTQLTSLVKNPLGSDVVHFVGPAVGGYAGGRISGGLVRSLGNRWAFLGKHGQPMGNATFLALAWLVSAKWKAAKRYQAPLLAGASIALIQSLVQTYLPQLSWLFDASRPVAGVSGLSGIDPAKVRRALKRQQRQEVSYMTPEEILQEEQGWPSSSYGPAPANQPASQGEVLYDAAGAPSPEMENAAPTADEGVEEDLGLDGGIFAQS